MTHGKEDAAEQSAHTPECFSGVRF